MDWQVAKYFQLSNCYKFQFVKYTWVSLLFVRIFVVIKWETFTSFSKHCLKLCTFVKISISHVISSHEDCIRVPLLQLREVITPFFVSESTCFRKGVKKTNNKQKTNQVFLTAPNYSFGTRELNFFKPATLSKESVPISKELFSSDVQSKIRAI